MKNIYLLFVPLVLLAGCSPSGIQTNTLTLPEINVSQTLCVDDNHCDPRQGSTFTCNRSITGTCYLTILESCSDNSTSSGSSFCVGGSSVQIMLQVEEDLTLTGMLSELFFCASVQVMPDTEACKVSLEQPAVTGSFAEFFN